MEFATRISEGTFTMKPALKVVCLIALCAVIYYLGSTPVRVHPKVIHVKTAQSTFEGTLRGIACVESNGNAECFLPVTN